MENVALRSDARQLANKMHSQVVAATAAAEQLEVELASRQCVMQVMPGAAFGFVWTSKQMSPSENTQSNMVSRQCCSAGSCLSFTQELAAALGDASSEHDALLTEAAAAAELRKRLAQVSAERDALSERTATLQQDARQQAAATAEAEMLAGASASACRQLEGELEAMRAERDAAAAELSGLRDQLEHARCAVTPGLKDIPVCSFKVHALLLVRALRPVTCLLCATCVCVCFISPSCATSCAGVSWRIRG